MVFIAIIAIILVLVMYFINFNGSLSNKQSDFGTFGDFTGGILNPIFGFLTFIAILYTIYIQTKELEYTREELEMTRGEFTNQTKAFKTSNYLQIISRNYTRLNELESSLSYTRGGGQSKEIKNDYKNLIDDIQRDKRIYVPYESLEALVAHIKWMENYIKTIELESIRQLMVTELNNHKQSFYLGKIEPILHYVFYKKYIDFGSSKFKNLEEIKNYLAGFEDDQKSIMQKKLAIHYITYFSSYENDFNAYWKEKNLKSGLTVYVLNYQDFLEIVKIDKNLIWE